MTEQEILEEKVLDKGFVRLLEFMGGDAGVVLAARVSHGQGLKGEEKDKKLLFYLMEHSHMTPFEQAVFKFHIKLPIFVMRQLVRHRVASLNEESARYREVEDQFYVPEQFRKQDIKNKQSSTYDQSLDQESLKRLYNETVTRSYTTYKKLLEGGAAREMARMVLPVSLYTQIYWTINARSLMNFILLRAEAHAQWEMRQYAEALLKFFKMKMPWSYQAFLKFVWKGGNPILDAEKAIQATEAI